MRARVWSALARRGFGALAMILTCITDASDHADSCGVSLPHHERPSRSSSPIPRPRGLPFVDSLTPAPTVRIHASSSRSMGPRASVASASSSSAESFGPHRHASTLGFGRALPAALAMQRFATSPEATQLISTGRSGASSSRARPRPHVTLWSSVAAGGGTGD